jgi:hypothetical protein
MPAHLPMGTLSRYTPCSRTAQYSSWHLHLPGGSVWKELMRRPLSGSTQVGTNSGDSHLQQQQQQQQQQ